MPILLNPRRERYAQLLAEGKSQTKAYVAAGYSPKSAGANSSTLLDTDKSIAERTTELLRQREIARTKALMKNVQNTIDAHLGMLEQLRDEARAAGRYADAITAETNRGKALGFYVSRSESGKPGEFNNLSDEELDAKIQALAAIRKAE